jgi:hypothetical protein
MERFKKPPLKRDFTHFMKMRLSCLGINPHRLKASCDLPMEKLV